MFLKEGSGVSTSNPCQGNHTGTGDASERTLDEPVLQGTTLVDLLEAFKKHHCDDGDRIYGSFGTSWSFAPERIIAG